MRMGHTNRAAAKLRAAAPIAAALVAVGASATALAASPKGGRKYSGYTNAAKFNGFRSPVGFKVAGSRRSLTGFTYSSTGCFTGGFGGVMPGVNYLVKPFNEHKVGAVTLAESGKFTVVGAISSYTVAGQKTVTTSSVTGRFKTAKLATGTITFSQVLTLPHLAPTKCGPKKLKFTVKVK